MATVKSTPETNPTPNAPPADSETPMNSLDPLEILSIRLNSLNQVIKLCAFSAEARRTLDEIQWHGQINQDFKKTLHTYIEASGEWTTHDDVLGLVLKDVSRQINQLNDDLASHAA